MKNDKVLSQTSASGIVSKKKRVLELFNSTQWSFSSTMNCDIKMFTNEEFEQYGLNGTVENNSQYCDVFYARTIIQEMGHNVLIGMAFHVYKDKFVKRKDRKHYR